MVRFLRPVSYTHLDVYKRQAWSIAIGLQAVDGLKPSKYLIDTAIKNIDGKITMKEAQNLIDSYYEERPVHLSDDERTEEADKVCLLYTSRCV